MQKKGLTRNTIVNILFVVLILVILFVPSAKALMIQGLMQIGLFKPSTEALTETKSDLTGIRFKDSKGNVVSLSDLNGKVIFLNFWATWCPPCLAEMPSINKLHQKFENDKDFVFLFVDADGDFAKAQAYMDRKKYKMPVFTFASELPKTIFKGTLPTTIVFDKKGRLSLHEEGAANYNDPKFINFVQQLKAQKD